MCKLLEQTNTPASPVNPCRGVCYIWRMDEVIKFSLFIFPLHEVATKAGDLLPVSVHLAVPCIATFDGELACGPTSASRFRVYINRCHRWQRQLLMRHHYHPYPIQLPEDCHRNSGLRQMSLRSGRHGSQPPRH